MLDSLCDATVAQQLHTEQQSVQMQHNSEQVGLLERLIIDIIEKRESSKEHLHADHATLEAQEWATRDEDHAGDQQDHWDPLGHTHQHLSAFLEYDGAHDATDDDRQASLHYRLSAFLEHDGSHDGIDDNRPASLHHCLSAFLE